MLILTWWLATTTEKIATDFDTQIKYTGVLNFSYFTMVIVAYAYKNMEFIVSGLSYQVEMGHL